MRPQGGGLPAGGRHTSLFVECVPDDASERESAHVFRPFYGYRGLRFVPRKERTGRLCFVDFDTPEQAASAMESLQGYVFDLKQPELRLRLQFAAGSKQPAPPVGMYGGGGGHGGMGGGGGMMMMGGGGGTGGGGMMLHSSAPSSSHGMYQMQMPYAPVGGMPAAFGSYSSAPPRSRFG
jgi:hypothetical protein